MFIISEILSRLLILLVIAPLLLVTTWISDPYPTCHGEGVVSDASSVTLIEEPSVMQSVAQSIISGSWLVYRMDIVLTLQNDWDQDFYGPIHG